MLWKYLIVYLHEELPSNAEKYVDDFSKLVHSIKSPCSQQLEDLWFDLPVRNPRGIWIRILIQTHLGVLISCLIGITN